MSDGDEEEEDEGDYDDGTSDEGDATDEDGKDRSGGEEEDRNGMEEEADEEEDGDDGKAFENVELKDGAPAAPAVQAGPQRPFGQGLNAAPAPAAPAVAVPAPAAPVAAAPAPVAPAPRPQKKAKRIKRNADVPKVHSVIEELRKRRRLERNVNVDLSKSRQLRKRAADALAAGEDQVAQDQNEKAARFEKKAEYSAAVIEQKDRFLERQFIADVGARKQINPTTNPVRRLITAFRVADRSSIKQVYSLAAAKSVISRTNIEILDQLMRSADVSTNDRRYLLERVVGTNVNVNADRLARSDRSDMRIKTHTALTCIVGGSGSAADRNNPERGYFYAGAFKETSFRVRHLLNGYWDPRRLFTVACAWLHDSLEFPHGEKVPGFAVDEIKGVEHKTEHIAVAFLCYSLSRLADAWGDGDNHMLLVDASTPNPARRFELIQKHLCQAIRNVLVGSHRLVGGAKLEAPNLGMECDRLARLDAINMGHGVMLTPNLNGRSISRLTGAQYRAFNADCSKVDTAWWSTSSVIQLVVKNIDWTIPAPQKREYAVCRAASRVYPSASALKAGLDAATAAADYGQGGIVEPVTHWEFHAPSKTFIAHVAEYGDPAGAVTYSLATMLGDEPGRPVRDEKTGAFTVHSPCPPRVSPLELVLQVFDALKNSAWHFQNFRGCSILQLLFRLEGDDKLAFTEFGAEREICGLVFGPRDTPNVVASILGAIPDERRPLPAPCIPAWAFGGADSSEHDAVNALLEMAIEACALEMAMAKRFIDNGFVPSSAIAGHYQAMYGGDHELRGKSGINSESSMLAELYVQRRLEAAVKIKKALEKFRRHRFFIGTAESHLLFSGNPMRRISSLLDALRPIVEVMPCVGGPREELSDGALHSLAAQERAWDPEQGADDMYPDAPRPYPPLAGAVSPVASQVVNAAYDDTGMLGLRELGWYDMVRSMLNGARDTA